MINTVDSDPEQRSLSYGRTLWNQFIQAARNASERERQTLLSTYHAEIKRSDKAGYIKDIVYKGFSQAEESYFSMRERLF